MNSTAASQVAEREQALLTAMRTCDVDLLDSLLHDDLLFNGPTGATGTKAADLANYRSGGIRLERVDARDRLISVIGDDVVVATTVALRGEYMGQAIDGSFRYLRVWKPLDGRWQVVGGSVVPLVGAG